jgi:hypothetical protein
MKFIIKENYHSRTAAATLSASSEFLVQSGLSRVFFGRPDYYLR